MTKTKFNNTSFKNKAYRGAAVVGGAAAFTVIYFALSGASVGAAIGFTAASEIVAVLIIIFNELAKRNDAKITDTALKIKNKTDAKIVKSEVTKEWKKEGVTDSVIITHNKDKMLVMDGVNKNGFKFHAIQNLNTGDFKVIKA